MNYFEHILKRLEDKKHIFLTGGAGVGKTTMTLSVIEHFEGNAKKVAKLASTGVSATLLRGETLHSFFDFGYASNMEELEKISKKATKRTLKKLISSIDLIIIDEISMVSASVFDMISIRLDDAGFNGSLLLVGDFLQLPPVAKRDEDVRFAFESVFWDKFNFLKIELTKVYRNNDSSFTRLLHSIRKGYVDEKIHNYLNSFITPIPNDLSEFTFLFGKNISAQNHNISQLESIDGEEFTKEVQIIKHKNSITDKQIEKFMNDARIEKELHLKIGAPVLFTRNSWNYFNGEKGIVVNYDTEYIYIKKDDGKIIKLQSVACTKYEWSEVSGSEKEKFEQKELFSIYHYPIKLAFAITIHKSQGMSIRNLIIQTNEIFAPSQFYVALSRSSNTKSLILLAPYKQWHEIVFFNQKAMKFYGY